MSGPPRPLSEGRPVRQRREITLRLPRIPNPFRETRALRAEVEGLREDVQRMLEGEMDFPDWVQYALDRGWITEPFCGMHDMTPTTPEEWDEIENGGDPCIPLFRVWPEMT